MEPCGCSEGCERCAYEGFIYPSSRPGKFLAGILDRRLLACALAGLEGELTRVVWAGPDFRVNPLFIEPEGLADGFQPAWRVAIMPMTPPDEEARRTELIANVKLQSSLLSWKDSAVLKLARAIKENRTFDCLPILADALEEAGCDNQAVLDHCRKAGPVHPRGCWVIELLTNQQ
jgi:hypothetical protein